MCESTAYVQRGDAEELLLEDVARVIPVEGGFLLLGLLFLLCLCLKAVTRYYGGKSHEGLLVGDRILRNLRTHGSEPPLYIRTIALPKHTLKF